MQQIIDLVNQVKKILEKYEDELLPPIEVSQIEPFKTRFKQTFGIDADEQYLKFLSICDGLELGGYLIYSSQDQMVNGIPYGLFERNANWHEYPIYNNFIFYGSSSLDIYIYKKKIKKYQVRDRSSGDVIKKFDTMEELLEHILKKMIL